MMRILISFSFIAFCISCCCNCNKKEHTLFAYVPKTIPDNGFVREFKLNIDGTFANTDHIFTYPYTLPVGFYIDTLIFEDSVKHISFWAYAIVCDNGEFKHYSVLLRDFLRKEFLYHSSFPVDIELNANPYWAYDLEAGPHQLFMNENVISMCFMVDSYSTGGNHHNYHWLTFNYDRKNKRQIHFSEVFPLKTKKDTIALVNHLNRKIEYDNLPEQYDSLDFAFTRGGVCFHTNWYMKQALLDSDSAKAYNIAQWYK